MTTATPRQIRLAITDDLPAINAIYNHYVHTSTCTYQTEPDTLADRQAWFEEHQGKHPAIVMEQDGEVIGWASLSAFRGRCGYRFSVENSVYVHHAHQGQGIGKALVLDLIERAKTLGYHTIVAGISADQTASRALHERLGFQQVAHFREVGFKFERRLDVVFLQLMLEAPTSGS
jgi:phosphinothricin acetyltransferase